VERLVHFKFNDLQEVNNSKRIGISNLIIFIIWELNKRLCLFGIIKTIVYLCIMKGVLDKITQEVELEGRSVTISCNGWELELSLDQSKQLMEFLVQIGNDKRYRTNSAGFQASIETDGLSGFRG
jgi:hypothetical protein